MNVGMDSALSGLLTAQRALDVASHNISNANTDGYSRQRADLSTNDPMGNGGLTSRYAGPGQVGTGVSVVDIKRVRDQFVDRQMRTESAPLGEANITADTAKQIQDIFGEPSDRSLASTMTKFWNAWQDVSTSPENSAYRANLREVSTSMAGVFQEVYGKLTNLRQDVNDRIQTTVNDVNSSLKTIAGLNRQISASLAEGQNPNDLQDQRDQAITKLSSLIEVNVVEVPSSGAQNVYIGGQPLVIGDTDIPLKASPVLANGFFQVNYQPPTPPGAPPYPPVQAQITGGSLNGLLNARNNTLSDVTPPGFIAQLNTLASNMMTAVNQLHSTGFGLDGDTTQNFFQGNNASDISVNPLFSQAAQNNPPAPAIKDGLRYIAAATNDPGSLAGGQGDNGNAIAIAQLRNQSQAALGNITFDAFYKDVITVAGTQGQEAVRKVSTQEQLVASVKQRIDQVSGVSTDEEMANVLKFQKAYAASAKVLTTIDQMLDTLLAAVGR